MTYRWYLLRGKRSRASIVQPRTSGEIDPFDSFVIERVPLFAYVTGEYYSRGCPQGLCLSSLAEPELIRQLDGLVLSYVKTRRENEYARISKLYVHILESFFLHILVGSHSEHTPVAKPVSGEFYASQVFPEESESRVGVPNREDGELADWFKGTEDSTWFGAAHACKEKQLLNGWERSFLYNMGRYAADGRVPSAKQLVVAKEMLTRVTSLLKTV